MRRLPLGPPSSCRPQITYPCLWQYKLIGESKTAIRQAVQKHVREDLKLTDSNVSRSGRYVSMNLEIIVDTEARRLELYQLLAGEQAVRVVL